MKEFLVYGAGEFGYVIKNLIQNCGYKFTGFIDDYKKGEEKALHFLLGQVMAATKGRADNKIAREVIISLLS